MNESSRQLCVSRRRFLAAVGAAAGLGVSARVLGGESSRLLPVDYRMRRLLGEAPLAMEFKGGGAAECRQWQQSFRSRVEGLMGSFRPPTEWESSLEERVEFPDHTREAWLLKADGLDPLPVYLLRPRNGSGGANGLGLRPGILALHGHGIGGYDSVVGRDDTDELKAEIERFRYDYGLKLVRRGYVVVAPCMTPFGRRLSADPAKDRREACEITQLRMQLVGKALMVENLRDVLWAFAFLNGQAGVDADRIGCVGLSLGGRMTMMAAAFEPRIRLAVMGGSLNCMQERAVTRSIGGCQVIPGLLNYGDSPEITGLIAPRPILWTMGDKDPSINPEWAERALVRIRRVYGALGAEDAVHVEHFVGGHEWHSTTAFPLIDQVLSS